MTPQSHSTPKAKPDVNKYDLEVQKEDIVTPVKPERKLQAGVNLGSQKLGAREMHKDEIDSVANVIDDSLSGE